MSEGGMGVGMRRDRRGGVLLGRWWRRRRETDIPLLGMVHVEEIGDLLVLLQLHKDRVAEFARVL